ncbi:glycoside hydrolase family 43 protein [Zhouia sp. PK063]|uniref:glycoside hydrolase family 43 protein n=1 Tax=Zhouia sp. PK063 TaxID=3373602 RepID=UPI0037A446B4
MLSKTFLTAVLLLITFQSNAQQSKEYSGNPIVTGWYADPEAIVYGNEYWIYPTSSTANYAQKGFDAFSSKDLVHWKKHPFILKLEDVSWAKKALWAPSVIHENGKYYFFFSANDVHPGEIGGIGVAVADKPEGPYKDLLGKPLINEIKNGAQPIDQFIFKDTDGSFYLYYGGWGHCNVVKLSKDFKKLIPFEDGKIYKEVTPKDYVEGAYMMKHNGKYYFMWSEGGWTGPDYSVAYAISNSPFGPFKRIAKILKQDPKVATGAGHHSVLYNPTSKKYYIVYHRRPLDRTKGYERVLCIDEMKFDKNGFIKPVHITFKGVKADPIKK